MVSVECRDHGFEGQMIWYKSHVDTVHDSIVREERHVGVLGANHTHRPDGLAGRKIRIIPNNPSPQDIDRVYGSPKDHLRWLHAKPQ